MWGKIRAIGLDQQAIERNALRDFVVRNLSASREVAMTETHLIFEHIRTGTVLT